MSKMLSKKIFQFLFVFILIVGWVFSGWSPIWQNPRVPPQTEQAEAAGAKMLLFWDGADAPSGWSVVTTFDGKFPRGEAVANFGVSGGNSSHTPTVSNVTYSTPSTGQATALFSTCSTYGHSHASLSVTVGSADNLPAFYSYKLIQYDAGIPVSIPAGAIAIFDGALPAGWTDQSSAVNNKMIRINSTAGAGGSDSHTHSLTWSSLITSSGSSSSCGVASNADANVNHTHTAPAQTATAGVNALPPYIQVIIAKADANTASLPNGLIAMFDGDPGSSWTVKSASGGPFYQQFIRGYTSYNGTSQGATTHNHANETSGSSGAASATSGGSVTSGTSAAGSSHTHTLTASFNSGTDNMPQYFNVVYAKKNTNIAPNVPSQELPNNNATGVSTTPTFTMTATDPDPDHLSYKVTIYSNSGCTSIVGSAHDQSTNSTGWTDTDANCTSNPTSCYNSGTQGSFALQSADALSYSTQYWWKVSAKDPDGLGTFTDSSTCNTFTTLAAVVSVTISSNGTISYGALPAGTSKSTIQLGTTPVAKNDGNVTETFNIKGQNTACPWTLATSTGSEQYKHEFSTNGGTGWTALTTSYQTLVTGVVANSTQNTDLRITVPTATNCYTSQSADVIIQATQ
ncbi:MAG: hypothetical protein PHT16_00050 [Candidatus Pacebacteria bacterium]|nr:hypothetical protein [Candidatus Paceibacterota bacterium]